MSRILIVTPAKRGSMSGNRVTAMRWYRHLRALGHRPTIMESYTPHTAAGNSRRNGSCGGTWDVLIALHARKSAPSVKRFRQQNPGLPIIVALTGTDLYRDLPTSKPAMRSLGLADFLVLLQPHGIGALPKRMRPKCVVIRQSAIPATGPIRTRKDIFEVCVSGHLRPIKDPFRTAMAVRNLPMASRIHVTHLGNALSPAMQQRAKREMERNQRYHWLGGVSAKTASHIVARSQLLVVSSKMEGGANVISEALVAKTPIIASRVSGNIGMLGDDYSAYFEVGATKQLSELLRRCETDLRFIGSLRSQCRELAKAFQPQREKAAWRKLLSQLSGRC